MSSQQVAQGLSCLVTGATGHLGSHVVKRLLEQGALVTITARPTSNLKGLHAFLGEPGAALKVVHADLGEPASLRDAVMSVKPHVVFHHAWGGITAAERNDTSQITRNLMGTLQLVQGACEAGCKAFVGVGSQAEYGKVNRTGAPDDVGALDALVPLMRDGYSEAFETYGVSKLCAGLLAREMCQLQGLGGVWLRLLATYGPGDDPRHLIPSVIQRLLKGERPSLTAGDQCWDYLYVEDAAEAVFLAGLHAAQNGAGQGSGTFDLGSGQAPTVREIVERIRDLIDPQLPLGLGDVPYREGQIMHLQADIAPLQKFIPWAPTTSLDEGLRRTIAFERAAREGVAS